MITLKQRINELVLRHGSIRKLGRVLRIDHAYLSRLMKNEKTNPSKTVLRKLGLRPYVVLYTRIPPV